MKKILIACDSFKGSLTSREAGEAIAAGFARIFNPDAIELKVLEVSDGGEGAMQTLFTPLKCTARKLTVCGPIAGKRISACYGISAAGNTAVMDIASAAGLALYNEIITNSTANNHSLAPRHLRRSTRGLGEMIADALGKGVKNIIIGLGGSATHDCGVGMLDALGVKFYDENDSRIHNPGMEDLELIRSVDTSELDALLKGVSIIGACDVSNPLYGPNGAAAIFAPQKGLGADITALDEATRKFAVRMRECGFGATSSDIAAAPGVGAAGGVGYALKAFMNASLKSGANIILDALHFDSEVSGTSIVITGEGRMDAQTIMGKLPAVILNRVRNQRDTPVIAFCGCVQNPDLLIKAGFEAIIPIKPDTLTIEESMNPATARKNLTNSARNFASTLSLQNFTSSI